MVTTHVRARLPKIAHVSNTRVWHRNCMSGTYLFSYCRSRDCCYWSSL